MNNQNFARSNNLTCPRCQLSHIKKNGHTYYGKQNHQCLLYDRQFVVRNETVSLEKQELIKSLLLERISLRGSWDAYIVLCSESRLQAGLRTFIGRI